MKRRFLSLLIAMSIAAPLPASAGPAEAKAFVDQVATQVLAIVKKDGISSGEKQAKVEAMFADKVDINFVSKFVLGKHWRTATLAQQKEYVAAYRPFILKNYASKLAKYSGETYTLKNARIDGDASVVTMEIRDPNGQDIIVDYRLHGGGSGYKIVDITIEGVGLLTTQRSEFNGIVENKGVDGLIAALRKQVASK
jgi:phospholipid transport system substrate-binding protein